MNFSAPFNYIYHNFSFPPFTIGRRLYSVISRIEPGWFLEKHLAIQATFALVTNYFIFNLKIELMKSFGTMDDYIFKTLSAETATEKDWDNFQTDTINIIQPLLFYIGLKLVFKAIETSYDSWINKEITQKVTAKVLSEHQVGIKLANAEATAEIVRNLAYDINAISSTGVGLVRNIVITTQSAALSFGHLHKLSTPINVLGFKIPDLMLISLLYSFAKQLITAPLAKKMATLNSSATMQQARMDNVMNYDFANVKAIITAKAEKTTAKRHASFLNKSNELNTKARLFNVVYIIWSSTTEYMNMIYKNIVMGYKVFTKAIKSEQIYAAWTHFNNVDLCLSWADEHQAELQNLTPSLSRVSQFLDHEQAIINSPRTIYYEQAGKNLLLKNLILSVAGKQLISIPKFSFQSGKRYVISGKAGSGKSSVVAKINRIIHDGIDATGIITFLATYNKTVMLTQDDYFPVHSSLLAVLCLPGTVPENLGEKAAILARAKALLGAAGFTRKLDLNEEKTNWPAELSGGEKKKIKIVSAIMQNPDILLLDEVFTGLDKTSVKDIQKMIRHYLPNVTIIAVDHHPDASRGFYNEHHAVENGVLVSKWDEVAPAAARQLRRRNVDKGQER